MRILCMLTCSSSGYRRRWARFQLCGPKAREGPRKECPWGRPDLLAVESLEVVGMRTGTLLHRVSRDRACRLGSNPRRSGERCGCELRALQREHALLETRHAAAAQRLETLARRAKEPGLVECSRRRRGLRRRQGPAVRGGGGGHRDEGSPARELQPHGASSLPPRRLRPAATAASAAASLRLERLLLSEVDLNGSIRLDCCR